MVERKRVLLPGPGQRQRQRQQSWQQSSQASPKLRFGLLGVLLEVGLACLLDDVVFIDLIWELIEGLTGLF
jgi:hypothetical protein